MPVVEVPCPGCGARLKAPDTMAGKKARCKKCGNSFRVPGVAPGGSAGDTPVGPLPTLPDADEAVPMAAAVEEDPFPLPLDPAARPARPAPTPAALPSADPFDFGKAAKPAPAPTPPAKPGFGAAKTPSTPRTPAASAPKPPPATAKPVVPTKPASPPPPKPQQEALSLDDAEPVAPDEPPAPAPAADNPFAFNSAPEPPARPGRRDEEDDRDDRRGRRGAARDEDEPRPRKRKRDERDERDDEEPRPRKRRSGGREEPAPAVPPGSNPFAFTAPAAEPERPARRRRDEDDRDDEDEPRPRRRRRGEEGPEDFGGPRYRSRKEKGGAGTVLLITGAVAFVALALGVVAVIVYVNKTRPPEQTKQEKKEEPPVAPPAEAPPADPPKAEPKTKEPAPKPKEAGPKPKEPTPKPKDPPVGAKVPTLALPARVKTFAVGPQPENPEPADKPKAGVVIDSPLASVRRVFPPFDLRTGDKHVLIQLAPGAGGAGEKLALDTYSASSDKRSGRIEFEGDGRPVPACDLHASVDGVRFLAAVGGKISVWNADDGTKLHDGLDPYAARPEHQKAGLAAAFFAAGPDQVVTVSTAGAVHLFDLRTRTATDEFVPRNAVAGKVALGGSVAAAEGGGSVVLVAGGVIYQVRAAPGLELVRTYDLGGEAARSLGLAVSGTPGRVLYTFETDKKERAVAALALGEPARLTLYRWPAALGEPVGALWAGGHTGGVATASGVVWFDDDEGKFLPLVATRPAGAGLHLGDDRAYWYVIPHPKEPDKSVVVALSMPFDDFSDFGKSYANNEPLRVTRIDHNGLAK